MKNKIVSIRFEEKDLKKLRVMAKKMRGSVSGLIRLTVAKIIEKRNNDISPM